MQPAIFSKNYAEHLEAAVQIGEIDSDRKITFRSAQRWASARDLLNEHGRGTLPVLFGVVDQGPSVRYEGRLQEVLLDPVRGEPRAEKLLLMRPPTTAHEDFWSDEPRTLYCVSGVRSLTSPIPYAALSKRSDGQPLSDDYHYGYALADAINDSAVSSPLLVASDIVAPPARFDVTVSRVVRDTALARQLKLLHKNQCQVCGTRLLLGNGDAYSEAHHLRPLGRDHDGPDVATNILVVCPNCHVLCDFRAIKLDRAGLRFHPEHKIADDFLEYHNHLADAKRAT